LSEITFSKEASEETSKYRSTSTAVREPPISSAPNGYLIRSNVFKPAFETVLKGKISEKKGDLI
jgi:hypothetical protein